MREAYKPDREWAAEKVAPFPVRWQARLISAWERERREGGGDWQAARDANIRLRETAETLSTVRLKLDAGDDEICTRAAELAAECADVARLYHIPEDVAAAMARICNRYGATPPRGKSVTVTGEISRMVCPLWWRRKLRALHAKAVEGAAITLGYVHKKSDIYVSSESLKRREQQNARNSEMMENTIAENEQGQQFTIAELAATSTANKAIRRAELMTRIAGFERVAQSLGHGGLFLTITCPSRMHKWRTQRGGVVPNRKYDGTKPNEAQAYLAKVWARIRAKLQREGAQVYGFRIAEPNHDGTPHWHLLVFHEADKLDTVRQTVTRYALEDSPNEAGAHQHRVNFKVIDWSKGTAAGYIAKYVAKNIDGYKVGQDLFGNDALETSARVEAWAATWRIRQFQQVGGPPVGVWRELRRVAELPEGVPDYLAQAHRAVNKLALIEGRENASVAWDAYCKAQGGVFVGRAARIKVTKVQGEGVGRYGDPLAPKPVGVETVAKEEYTPAHMAHMGGNLGITRLVHWFVESVRHAWVVLGRKKRELEGQFKGALRPWTCVNNCTEVENGNFKKTSANGGFSGHTVGAGTCPHTSDGGAIHWPAFGGIAGSQCGA